MAAQPAPDVEYIPVEQAAGALPQPGRAFFRNLTHTEGEGASAEITLYGIRDSDTYSIRLTVNAATPIQALDNLMSGIREARRIYALSPIQPKTEKEPIP